MSSSTPNESDEESIVPGSVSRIVSESPLPESKVAWTLIAVSLILISLGAFVVSGEMAGIYGIWGISLFVAICLYYGAVALWHYMG